MGRRPRPVADAPAVDAIVVAKGWLLTLVAAAPLAQAASVPAAELARGGPSLCSAVLAALSSDAALDRLVSGAPAPAESIPRLTGARTPAETSAAVEALRVCAWRVLRGAVPDPSPELLADLGDRLAHVCARVAQVALGERPAEPRRGAGPLAEVLRPAATAAPAEGARVSAPAAPSAPPPGAVRVEVGTPAPDEDDDPLTSLAEELSTAPPAGVRYSAPAHPVADPAPTGVRVTRRRPVDTSWSETTEAGPPWLAAIGRRLDERGAGGPPFGILVAEVDDLDRLLASESGREVAFALEAAERGLSAELAQGDLVVRERLGRWWMTCPDRDAAATRALGHRVAAAIGRAVLGGAALSASVGIGVCPDDGETVETLAGRAEEGMFAARAAGVPLVD